MKTSKAVALGLALIVAPQVWAEGHTELLQRYAGEAGEALSAERGQVLWESTVDEKSCTTCHNSDITQPGQVKILFLSKRIKPMALSANPKRFQDSAEVEKAFDKNCKRVFGRVCTAKEKGDILTYLTSK